MDSIINEIAVGHAKLVDDTIFMEVSEIVKENGILSQYLINEDFVIPALKNYIPRNPHLMSFNLHCPSCNKVLNDYEGLKECFCKYCGQRIWRGGIR